MILKTAVVEENGCRGRRNKMIEISNEQKEKKYDFNIKTNVMSSFKHVIGVVSGKGGVGKSSVTAMMAVEMNRKGYRTAVLDADITGPSIPKAYGIKGKALATEHGVMPVETRTGIELMSINLLLENETDPVVWRGPILANTVKQFFSDVVWGENDFLFIDMPPGTGDVPLTVFQSITMDGIIIVTSPQELVSMVVSKAVKMADMMNIKVLGVVENYSHFTCPDTGKEYKIFGESHLDEISGEYGLEILGKISIDPNLAEACDKGEIERHMSGEFTAIADKLEEML